MAPPSARGAKPGSGVTSIDEVLNDDDGSQPDEEAIRKSRMENAKLLRDKLKQ
jgi:hypothetical protein